MARARKWVRDKDTAKGVSDALHRQYDVLAPDDERLNRLIEQMKSFEGSNGGQP